MSRTKEFTRLQRQTVSAALADELRRRILSLEIPEGQQLRQDNLAAEFGVSRIPVREALVQLEAEGLVSLSAHRGYTVTSLSLDDIRELFDLRALIEVDLLRRSIPCITAEDIRAARQVLNTFDEALRRGTHERDWGQLNWHLHSALYAPARRGHTMRIVQNLNRQADRYLRLQLKITRSSNERARREHAQLVDLCEARDIAEASRLLNEHILNARDELIAFLAKKRQAADAPEPVLSAEGKR